MDAEAPKRTSEPAETEGLPAPAKAFSITQYNKSVERRLKQVPQVWVKGVVTQLNVRGRIVYITLGEFEEGDAKPKAVLDVTLWTAQLDVFNLRFSQLPTPLALRVELKVAFLLEANFYVPSGRFQPKVVDINEHFTIGELSLTRQRTVEKLHREGLLERNKLLPLSDWPLRVGLITAPGSAAYQDFTTVLLQSGFSFQIFFAGAKMQGDATESTVLEALERLGRLALDAICIVRGGGAKTDLVYFDSEAICRAIALCQVPVLTGIGHEIDNSLADLVAHADKITPTDCAKFLENRVAECYARLSGYAGQIAGAWRMEFQQAWHEQGERASILKHQWESRQAREEFRCREKGRRLSSLAKQILKAENRRMAANRTGLSRGPQKILDLESMRFAHKSQTMKHAWQRLRADRQGKLRESYLRLRERALQGLRGGGEALDLKSRLVHAADPARLLALGFSLLRDRRGELVRSLSQVSENDVLVNQLRDGSVESRVLSKKELS